MECNVVVVGDARIGKTALIHRLTENVFLEVRIEIFLIDGAAFDSFENTDVL